MDQSTFMHKIGRLFRAKSYGTRSFTYFIPAPPKRKQGYQEKEFDTVLDFVLSQGYTLIDCKLEAISNDTTAGVWAFCILEAQTKEAFVKTIDIDYLEVTRNQEQAINISSDIVYD